MRWTCGIASEALVMPAVSMTWCFGFGPKMWLRLSVDRCVQSGSILAVCSPWCLSVRRMLWTLCLFGRNISMLLSGLSVSTLLIAVMTRSERLAAVLCLIIGGC